jgi:DNA-binding transcriptional MerR regulator
MARTDAPYRIGEVAERAGVSTRTLRYYQELGLLDPAGTSSGGNRRYSDDDVARLERILELRNVMGFDLERIHDILHAEDRLAAMGEEVRRGISRKRHQEIIAEAVAINRRLREQVAAKMAVLRDFDEQLAAKHARYEEIAEQIGADAAVTG